jgi:putative oxygen-independent coproporphyrinogen III oxidase
LTRSRILIFERSFFILLFGFSILFILSKFLVFMPFALPLSLYVHLPWCVRKCPYCDFNSHEAKSAIPEDAYVDALLADLEQDLPRVAGRELISVFFGGGTPSLFSPDAIGRILAAVRARLPCAPDLEVTLEANPGTVEQARFEGFRAAGVNRLSIGIQSFDDRHLKILGRIHGAAEARRAAAAARAAGFDNFNLDLMYALPGQCVQEARTDLEQAIALEPAHISYYQLTLEPNTLFYQRPPPLPDEETAWAMHEQGESLLAAAGYAQYEVSAYARPGRQCRHNRNYWAFGDYLGIGAGAHGKLTGADGRVWRTAKQRHPRTYQDTAGTPAGLQRNEPVPAGDLPLEFLMNALRLNEGFTLADYQARTGLGRDSLEPVLGQAQAHGLLEAQDGRLRASPLGRRHLDGLLALFLPDPPRKSPLARPAAVL